VIDDPVTKTAVGQPIGAFFGYVTDGIFQTYEEVRASAQYDFGKNYWEQTTKPGDFRFKDLNGDGKITNTEMNICAFFTCGADFRGLMIDQIC
jgi:hypothetical protein